ncbi:MAG TPA: (S)-ureidoglycine aminohydrolase [Candidatus Lachnoclostridium stercoravium]|uniref:(S)-ureidoglycine aminohydrolase n=1 Tax=Candidatus Lachnoclostridium stercoravium TaxID=2838633 RepID=A0A9D2KNZ1_9FIRM|nr:(S)-ureidoglycine aminohydrolase [Candidatus Lachnoclostridium stercoravium]
MLPTDKLLLSRARIVPGYYALIPPEGRVYNTFPHIQGKVAITATPKLGAGFVSYVIRPDQSKRIVGKLISDKDIEYFLYINNGMVNITTEKIKGTMEKGFYMYLPPNQYADFESWDESGEIFLYKRKYVPLEGKFPWFVWGNASNIPWHDCEDAQNLLSKELLPSNEEFDIGFHILRFKKGGCHGFVETHYQEHGAFILQGQGMYLLDTIWSPVKKGDFIWMGPFVPQAAYGIGEGEFSYLLSKDCNRDFI